MNITLNNRIQHRYMKLILSLLLSSLFIFNSALAQEEHIIETELKTCLKNGGDQSTVGMIKCTQEAEFKWDQELNKYYQLLMKDLNEEGQESLRTSQRQWIVYRDKEFDFIKEFYYNQKQGTMWHIMAADKRKELIADRAIELQVYYGSLDY